MDDGHSNHGCAHCGAHVVQDGKHRKIYCGDRCRAAARHIRRGPRPGGPRARRPAVCGQCGADFQSIPSGGNGRWTAYCSRPCGQRSRQAAAGAVSRLVASEVKALRRIGRRKVKQVLTRKPCTGCGALVLGKLQWRRTCGACAAERSRRHRRVAKALRRARQRATAVEPLDPIKVLERDGWRCRLCGIDTPPHLRGTCDPAAPEMDHIVPLALGGAHTMDNVQCACRACNGAKGASVLPLAA